MTDTTPIDAAAPAPALPPVVVKKYANRRLYNTETSSYITLDNLADMVRAGRDFVVYDARSGDDITRNVLTQIIVEEENKGRALLPTTFLRQLIGFYGDSLGGAVPRYLEQTMSTIARQQEQMRDAMKTTMGSLLPPGLEEMRRQNVAIMERAMSLFTPFYRPTDAEVAQEAAEPVSAEEVAALRREVEDLRAQLAAGAEIRPLRKA
jgi:polyhydroxyalkanoate synthesis repressor PhaR